MGVFFSQVAYGLSVLLDLTAFVLILEWIFFYLPGSQWNGVRRGLWNLTYPLLSLGERFFSLRVGKWSSRGLGIALGLLALGCLGVPWLVFWAYSLRG